MKAISLLGCIVATSSLVACNDHKYHPHIEHVSRGSDGGYYVKDDSTGNWLMYMAMASDPAQGPSYYPYRAPLVSSQSSTSTVSSPSSVTTPSPVASTVSPATSPTSSSAATPSPITSAAPVAGSTEPPVATPAGPTTEAANNSVVTTPTANAEATQSLPGGFWVDDPVEPEIVSVEDVDVMGDSSGNLPSNPEEAEESSSDSAEESAAAAESESDSDSESDGGDSGGGDSGGGDGGGGE